MIRSSITLVLINLVFINGNNHWCDYWAKKSDDQIEICSNDQCANFVDLQWILVRPLDCKTYSLSLAFSTYEKYEVFLKNIQWKLSDLFPSKKSDDQLRKLNIFLENLAEKDQPLDQFQLDRLGNHLDLYYIYIRNISSNHSISPLIHFSPNQSQWNFIQIQLFVFIFSNH